MHNNAIVNKRLFDTKIIDIKEGASLISNRNKQLIIKQILENGRSF